MVRYCHSIIIPAYKAILPLQILRNGIKLPWPCFITFAPGKTIVNTVVIYRYILTLEQEITMVNYHSIFITSALLLTLFCKLDIFIAIQQIGLIFTNSIA